MSKQFSIVAKSIDLDELDEQIKNYECKNGEVPYLFMNSSTGNAILEELCKDTVIMCSDEKLLTAKMFVGVIMGTYKGYKVFQNEDLVFGEIEIR